jgi:hypothetical protein
MKKCCKKKKEPKSWDLTTLRSLWYSSPVAGPVTRVIWFFSVLFAFCSVFYLVATQVN